MLLTILSFFFIFDILVGTTIQMSLLYIDPIWLLTCMSDKPVSAICGSKLEPNLWLQKLVHIRWFLLNLDFLECVACAILIFGKNSFFWGIKHFLTSSGSNFSNFGTLTHLTFLSLIKELLRAETQLPYGLALGIWGSKWVWYLGCTSSHSLMITKKAKPLIAMPATVSGMTIDIINYVSGYKCHVPVSKMLLFLSYLMKCCHFSHFWGYKWRRRRFVHQCSPSRPGTQLNTRHKCYRTHLVSIWGIYAWDLAFVSKYVWNCECFI